MRNLKKFLALVLAMLMIVSASATVSAFTDVDKDNQYADAIADLVEKEIVNGVGDDKFDPTAGVERFQMALMMARTLNPTETNWQDGMNIFTDVNEWYGAIAYAYMNNIVTGIGGGKFDPHAGIKYQDALIMAVRALGYKVDVTGDPYWLAAYNQAQALGLTENVSVFKGEQALNRAECAQIIYNMLYATPADGSATIAAKNFGEATAQNTTTFVITATPKQYYAESIKAAEDGYVGVQQLANGLPSGDVTYYPVEALGIEAADIENYFNYAIEFVNYDAKTGAFDKAILGDDPTVAYNTNISVSSPKVTYNGVTYYPVEKFTGAALKNEIIMLNGGELASAAKMLLTDKDGNIVDYNGTKLATFAYQTPSGDKYFAYKPVEGGETKVINEATATEKFGVIIDDSTYSKYATLTAAKLTGNYQLSMFDDDHDGKFERAIVTPVYMSVFNNKDGKKINIVSTAFASSTEGITLTETLAKGDVFTFTYNSQTKVIDVLDVLSVKLGTLVGVNLTADKAADYKVTINVDGKDTQYKFANENSNFGANFSATNSDKLNGKTGTIDNVISGPAIRFVTYKEIIANASKNSTIKFYEYNGYLIYAESYNIEVTSTLMAVTSVTSYDADTVTVAGYLNGVKGEYNISKITDSTGKVVTLSDLSIFKLTTVLSNLNNNAEEVALYKCVPAADGTYQLSAVFNNTNVSDSAITGGISNNYVANGYNEYFKLYQADAIEYTFKDGITGSATSDIKEANRIRTNASTKFYFIDTKLNTLTYVTGITANDYKIAATAKVFADQIGYGTADKNGMASTVVVYYKDKEVTGFGITSSTSKYVYIPSVAKRDLVDIDGSSYWKYDSAAIDMSTGEKTTIYASVSKTEFNTAGRFYMINDKGIVTEDITDNSDIIKTTKLAYDDVNLTYQYKTITNAGWNVVAEDEVTSVMSFLNTSLDKKTDMSLFIKKENDVETKLTRNVSYLVATLDSSKANVVMIVGSATGTKPVDPTTYHVDGYATLTVTAAGGGSTTTYRVISGKEIYLDTEYDDAAATIGSDIAVANRTLGTRWNGTTTAETILYQKDDNSAVVDATEKYTVRVNVKDGVIETVFYSKLTNTKITPDAGTYQITTAGGNINAGTTIPGGILELTYNIVK